MQFLLYVELAGNIGTISSVYDTYEEALKTAYEYEFNFPRCKWEITGSKRPEVLQ